MGFKNKLGIFVSACAIIGVVAFGYMQINSNNTETTETKESYSTESVIHSLWDKYEGEIQSTQMPSEDFPIVDVSVFDKEYINKVDNYLENNLSKKDLEHYKLNVYQWSSDQAEFKKNAQENLNSDDLKPNNN